MAATGARGRQIEVDGLHLAIVGHPYWVDGATRSTDLHGLAHALRDGADALSKLVGDFALAAWDERTRRGLLAVDRIGVHPLFYGHAPAALVFASNLDLLRGHPDIRTELSDQGLYDFLYFHVCAGPHTIFTDLERLPAGHCIEFDGQAAGAPRPYWTMRFAPDATRPLQALEDEFVGLLSDAVKELSADASSVGTFLSGGTDSSTVSGLLGRTTGAPAHTFSIGFDVQGYDEMEYARVAARHFGCDHHEYYVTPGDVVDAVPKIAAWYDQPFGNASAVPTYYCARVAREHGIERMLAGDGGDELFGGNERYAKQHLFGLYQHVPSVLRRGLIEPALLALPADLGFAPLRKLRSYVEQARPPMPQRYQTYNLLNYLGQSNVFESDFLAGVDQGHPLALLIDGHKPYVNASLIDQMLAIDLRFILADGDLPKVTRMCAMAGVDVAFPMLDDRVVAFSATLTAKQKLRGTQLRWFFKHALRNFLPSAVLTKQKHGFGLPVGAWLVGHKPLLDLAGDSIGGLRQRGIVQPRFLDDLFATRLREHPPFFGGMVWVLMMLGIWLESRGL
ncbi:MAG TPA: asparagine synthase-related protein [Burkholderiaceae bacterium]|nr:asparagine synthase-related protein [Burkholderiaceae bacterium]